MIVTIDEATALRDAAEEKMTAALLEFFKVVAPLEVRGVQVQIFETFCARVIERVMIETELPR